MRSLSWICSARSRFRASKTACVQAKNPRERRAGDVVFVPSSALHSLLKRGVLLILGKKKNILALSVPFDNWGGGGGL